MLQLLEAHCLSILTYMLYPLFQELCGDAEDCPNGTGPDNAGTEARWHGGAGDVGGAGACAENGWAGGICLKSYFKQCEACPLQL